MSARCPSGAGSFGVPGSDDYTIVLIPDTQFLAQDHPEHLDALSDWIADNKDAWNIQLVLHLGDIVNDSSDHEQWDNAAGPLDTLYGLGIPVVSCVGNHDYQGDIADRDTTNYNVHLGGDRYLGEPWFDGDFREPGATDNMYLRTTLGGVPTLVLALELFPRTAVMEWADEVIRAHPRHEVIVLMHAFLSNDGARTRDGGAHGPHSYVAADAMSGQQMWESHFRHHPNLVAVYNGHHISGPSTSHRAEFAEAGNRVFQQLTNWQQYDEGGEGRLVLHTIKPTTGDMRRQVYNPARERFEDEYELHVPGTASGGIGSPQRLR